MGSHPGCAASCPQAWDLVELPKAYRLPCRAQPPSVETRRAWIVVDLDSWVIADEAVSLVDGAVMVC
jgi:hypothetical protein